MLTDAYLINMTYFGHCPQSCGLPTQHFAKWMCFNYWVYRFLLSWDPSKELSSVPGHWKEFSRICIVLASDISRKWEEKTFQ